MLISLGNTIVSALLFLSPAISAIKSGEFIYDTREYELTGALAHPTPFSHYQKHIAPQVTRSPDVVEALRRDVTITGAVSATDDIPPAMSTSAGSTVEAMPTLSNDNNNIDNDDLPTPTVIIPSNDGNPFIKSSSLPEGTVFICVGAILGGLLAAVLIWRLAAGIALQRSIRAAERADIIANGEDKTLLENSQPLFGPGSNQAALNNPTDYIPPRTEKKDRTRARMSGIPSQGGLFFSPTADVLLNAQSAASTQPLSSVSSTTMVPQEYTPHNPRSTAYVPAGYYGSGSASVRISRSISPNHLAGVPSRYSAAESNRPPSAYLDDLLAHSDSE